MKYIKTSDVFNVKDKSINIDYFVKCSKIAKELKVFDTFGVSTNGFPTINLKGQKNSIVKYYWRTLLMASDKLDGFKRFVDILLT